MRSYAQECIFSPHEIALWEHACRLIARIPDEDSKHIRCHELARAVGRILVLPHQDGHYGFVEHTWLWTETPPQDVAIERWLPFVPNILDVYAPGKLPQVQLVHAKSVGLPHIGWSWRPGNPREDIDADLVDHLVRTMRPA